MPAAAAGVQASADEANGGGASLSAQPSMALSQPVAGMPPPEQVQQLLGAAGQGTLPIWLKPEAFLAATFEPEACVGDLRRYAPLSTLKAELQSYLTMLKSKMVEVINEDYQDYVSLSAKLVNVDGAVLRMRKPLLELKDKLGVVAEAVRGELHALAAGLKRRKEVALSRNLLELLQELSHVASKVEKLLAEVAGDDGSSDPDTRARLLERVAVEVSRLTFQANRGKDLAFVRAMEPRISSACTTLQDALGSSLRAALAGAQSSAALHCMHAYAELGLTEPVEEALRRQLVSPLVSKLIADHKGTHTVRASSAAAAGSRDDGLAALLKSLEQQSVEALGPLLTACLAPQSPLRVFDVLGNVLLAEVDAALASQLPAVFSPGVPPAFHANFIAAQALLESLEGRCTGRTALDRLRASPAYASFNRRWNTSVYFSLFYQDVAGDVEDAVQLGKPDLSKVPPSGGSGGGAAGGDASGGAAGAGALLPLGQAVTKGLTRCSSPAVFLQPLADRFLKLALQLCQRYLTWLQAALVARQQHHQHQHHQHHPPHAQPPHHDTTHGQHPHPHQHQHHSRSASNEGPQLDAPGSAAHAAGSPSPPPPGANPSSGAGGAGAGGGAAWVAGLPLDELCVLHLEAEAVAAHLRTRFAPEFLALLLRGAAVPPEVAEGVGQGLEALADQMQAQGAAVLSWMSDEVAEACVALVRQLKGITATYRMTTKGAPTRHSHYVTGVLGPLRALLEGPRASRLHRQAQQQLAASVAEAVTTRYQALAEELLNTVRKTESSINRIQRLKKVQQTDAAGDASGSGLSDTDKITLQLYLDVHEYGQQMSRFGLVPASMPSFVRLLEVVTPPQAVLDVLPPGAVAGNTA